MLGADDEVAIACRFRLQRLSDVLHFTDRNRLRAQCANQRLVVPARKRVLQYREQHLTVLGAALVLGKAWVAVEIWTLEHVQTQAAILLVVAHGQGDAAIGGVEQLVGHDAGVRIAVALRHLTRVEVAGRDIGQKVQRTVGQRDIHRLTEPGLLALEQRRQDALNRVHARDQIDESHAQAHGLAVLLARDRHETAFGLDDEVVARPVFHRVAAPVSGNRAMDEPRIDRCQRFVIQPEALEARRQKIFDHDVGLRGQIKNQLTPLGFTQVHRQALLVAIGAEVVGGDAGLGRRHPAAGVVTLQAFDLPHLGAEVRQGHGRPGPGEDACQIQYLDALQNAHRLSF